jgi:predicted kinase
LAHEQLTAGTVRLVLIGGLPGTGKSALAEALAARRGWVVVNTDAVRRELAGGPVPERWGEGVYRQEATDHVYQHVLTRCAIALARGETVIVDASFHDASRREAARQLAAAAGAALTELVCVAPAALSDRRLQARDRTHPSDATPDVAREMARAFAPWPQATVLDTTEPLDQTVRRASVRTAGS